MTQRAGAGGCEPLSQRLEGELTVSTRGTASGGWGGQPQSVRCAGTRGPGRGRGERGPSAQTPPVLRVSSTSSTQDQTEPAWSIGNLNASILCSIKGKSLIYLPPVCASAPLLQTVAGFSCGAVTSQVGGVGNPRGLMRGSSAEPASLWRDQGLDVWVPQFPATLSQWEEGPCFQNPCRELWPEPSRGTKRGPEGPERQRPSPADQAWHGGHRTSPPPWP